MKSNSDVSLFVDSITKLGEDINKNYTPDDIKPEVKSEAEQLFDAAFADNTGTKKVFLDNSSFGRNSYETYRPDFEIRF